mmetsp:Transcript_2992/g.5219  ORF Transcript_2992/g.5219 Transcript_2992/m.5219 type:complete len:632 (-) Transcript_2992:50-1945(-)
MPPCRRIWPLASILVTANAIIRREHPSQTPEHAVQPNLMDTNASHDSWHFCAKQWEECNCRGRVRWGNRETWKVLEPPAVGSLMSVKCNIQQLHDVLPGDDGKHCQCQGHVVRGSSLSPHLPQAFEQVELEEINAENAEWVYCSNQWQDCQCNNEVRWGNGKKWTYIRPQKEDQIFSVKCDVHNLGDPLPGEDGKHCQCLVKHDSTFERQLNPMLLREELADRSGSRLVASCDIFEAAKEKEPQDRALWEAVEPFCSQSWEAKAAENPELHAGPRQLSLSAMQKLMQARIDARFVQNYERLINKDGWLPRAFVNYYAGAPGSKHANMTEQLIRSVHMFSEAPIVVLHLGSRTPDTWTADRFPRLLLLHAAPMEPDAHRSFNFNKLRSFLVSRALSGVELDSDQFVGPGVDYMFQMTEKEITQDTPLPVLPVHFYSFTQADTPNNVWWQRYCPDPPACKHHTMRWSHAHPTWTFYSLPFLGRWLRRHFRDEQLAATSDEVGNLPALSVASIPEDEDLLNVATWEEKGTKQWCKFDNDYHEFADMLGWSPEKGAKTTAGDIATDPKFYPDGAAKAFWTAHNCKDPAATAKMLDEIEDRWQKGLYPQSTITYKGRFWQTGAELREAYPDLPCIF